MDGYVIELYYKKTFYIASLGSISQREFVDLLKELDIVSSMHEFEE